MKRFFLIFLFVHFTLVSIGQLIPEGQSILENNPTGIRWYQVNTPHFRILYSKGFEVQAQRMANTLEHLREPVSKTLTSSPPKISVLLQNQSALSNGFVSYIPRRVEFYAMPSQDYNFIGTNDWLDMLATHESRHVVQFEHARQGVNRLIYYLFGYSALTGLSQVAVPQWFWEGDAVGTETALTHSGRGRIPNFGLVFRTNLLEGRVFNYHKQYLRSYKHNIPNHYVLGYYMTSYLRRRTNDPLIWDKITARAWRSSIIPFTFSSAIKKETGFHVSALYREMAKDLKKEWKQEVDSMVLTPFEKIGTKRTNAYADYQFPQQLSDGNILVMKSGIGDIEQFVILKNRIEKKVFVPGFMNNTGMLSVADQKIVWNEYAFDPRWRVRNYSTIKMYDISSGKVKRLSPKRSRFAAAALSPDGKNVVTIKTDNSYRHTLVVLNTNGVVVKEIPNPENNFYSMPRWSNDGGSIVVLKTTENGKSVIAINASSGVSSELMPESDENIGYPVLYNNYLLYNSPEGGIDNIFALNTSTGEKYQITVSRYGAYNPAVSTDGKTLYYNDQSRNGLDVVRVEFNPSSWRKFEKQEESVMTSLSNTLTQQEGNSTVLATIPKQQFPVVKYNKAKGLINPYNWGVYIENNDFLRPTIGLASRDILSTTSLSGGYWYDIFENTGAWFARASYQGFYPIIDAEINYGQREIITGIFGRDVKFNWTETSALTGLRLPLLLTRSKYSSRLEISNSFGITQTASFKSEVSENNILIRRGVDRYVPANDSLYYLFANRTDFGSLLYNRFTFAYSRSLKQSRRDFNPRMGQFLNFEHYSTPYGGDFSGWLWAARGLFYFPGILKHHSLYVRGNYQVAYNSSKLDTYSFRNRIFKPRGLSYPADHKFYSFSVNYSLPLWYPDISIGPLLNIQRLKTNFFVDYGQGTSTSYYYNFKRNYYRNEQVEYSSVGAEVTIDVNFFRLLPQFEIGFRTTYRQENIYNNGGVVFEFLLGNISL